MLVLASAVPASPLVVIPANDFCRYGGAWLSTSGRVEVIRVHGAGPKLMCLAETVSAARNGSSTSSKRFAVKTCVRH